MDRKVTYFLKQTENTKTTLVEGLPEHYTLIILCLTVSAMWQQHMISNFLTRCLLTFKNKLLMQVYPLRLCRTT